MDGGNALEINADGLGERAAFRQLLDGGKVIAGQLDDGNLLAGFLPIRGKHIADGEGVLRLFCGQGR